MKIVISIDSIKYPLTGIGRYNYELIKALQKSPDISGLLFLSGSRIGNALPDAGNSSSVHQWLKKWAQKNSIFSQSYYYIQSQLKERCLRQYQDFIYHSPNFYLPPFAGKNIATFHDLSIFTWPQCHPKERVRYMQKELLLTIKRANALITDSQYTRKELADYFNLPLERIFAIPLASAEAFYPRTEIEVREVLQKYHLQYKKYLLFTGTIEPRKNLKTLIQAYERLPSTLKSEYPLVISGYRGWESDEIHARILKGQSQGWIHYLGFTPANELPLLFAGAKLFVFPSLYEGFGLPVLEAMASGVPVISSNAASLPEVVGDAALLFDPLDVEQLSELIKQALGDTQWHDNAVTASIEQAKQFSWRQCAEQTIDVYKWVESL